MRKLVMYFSLSFLAFGCLSKTEKSSNSKDSLVNKGDQSNSYKDIVDTLKEASFSYPIIESPKEVLIEFIPTGWVILDSVSFDYDNDSLIDYVVIIETIKNVEYSKMWGTTESEMNDKPRVLFVLNGTKNGFSLTCQANELILTSDQGGMMGDPYQGISVSDNRICTSFWGGSGEKWNLSHCFDYQENNWVLSFTETSGGNAELMYRMSYDLKTGNYFYEYLEEKHLESEDSTKIVKDEKYSKQICVENDILMDSFRPWTLEIDSVFF